MLRDKNLIPLSHQHQHVLALCVRLDRAMHAGDIDLEAWQAEIQQLCEAEILIHFAAEEQALFPVAVAFPSTRPLVDELLTEHTILRDFFTRATERTLDTHALEEFVEKLAHHIRKEERLLFEDLQKVMDPQALADLGAALGVALQGATKTCSLPNPATRLRPKS